MGFLRRLLGGRRDLADDQWQTPIVQEICFAMVRQIPEHWNRASLVLEVPEHGLGRGLVHSAITPEPCKDSMLNGDFVTPDADVMIATRKLELGWLERKAIFRRAIITAVRDTEGDWEIRSEYEHEG